MYQRRRARIVLIVLIVAALVLVTLDFRSDDDEGSLSGARGAVATVVRPVQEGLATLVRPIGNLATNISDLFSTRSENQQLRDRVETLEDRRRVVTDLVRENEELRDLLAIRDRTELETVAARTVALSPSSFEWTITIDVGTDDGIERDMPVINGDGLVGRVIQVSNGAARVLLAIDPSFSAGARTARTAEVGLIDGRGGEPMRLQPLDPEADVQEGDEIVTSSYQGGIYPTGIPIGTVSSVSASSDGLSQEITVSPYVDFTKLHHVLVVQNTAVEEMPPFTDTDGLPFTRPDVDPTRDPDDNADPDADDDDADNGEDSAPADPDDVETGDGDGDGDGEEDVGSADDAGDFDNDDAVAAGGRT